MLRKYSSLDNKYIFYFEIHYILLRVLLTVHQRQNKTLNKILATRQKKVMFISSSTETSR